MRSLSSVPSISESLCQPRASLGSFLRLQRFFVFMWCILLIDNDYSAYVAVISTNQSGNDVTYYDSRLMTLNGIESKTASFITFNRTNDTPSTVNYSSGLNVNASLVKGLQVEQNGDNRGTISGGTIVKNGDVFDGLVVSITKTDGKTTFTFNKPVPYKYSISESSNNPIAFDPDYSGNWYMLSTLTKDDGEEYYYLYVIIYTADITDK